PRKPGSHWRPINIEKVEALIKAGHMKPQGLSVYALRKPESSDVYHQMREDISLAPALEKQFKRNKKPGIFSRNSPHPTGRPPSNGLRERNWKRRGCPGWKKRLPSVQYN